MQPRQLRKILRLRSQADHVEIELTVAFKGADFSKYAFAERIAINVLGNKDGIAEENLAAVGILFLDNAHRVRLKPSS